MQPLGTIAGEEIRDVHEPVRREGARQRRRVMAAQSEIFPAIRHAAHL